MRMRVDAHQHYWKLDRGDYGWLTEDAGILYRDYMPEDLKPILAEEGIDATVVVQAAPTVEETRFLLELAAEEPTIAGVVGWLDMEAADFEARLDEFSREAKFVGIRPMIQDLADTRWMVRPRVLRSFEALEERGTAFDFLTLPRHLPFVSEVLQRVPRLHCIIDHISKPDIKEGTLQPWADDLARVAERPNVYCKLSGMVTEADHSAWRPEHLVPFVEHVLGAFGAERLVYGSDWPVCLLAADYAKVHGTLQAILSDRLSDAERKVVFGGNAASFYRL